MVFLGSALLNKCVKALISVELCSGHPRCTFYMLGRVAQAPPKGPVLAVVRCASERSFCTGLVFYHEVNFTKVPMLAMKPLQKRLAVCKVSPEPCAGAKARHINPCPHV